MKFQDQKVAAVFDSYPQQHRKKMMALRKLIFEVAGSIEEVGTLTETLKWGEPAYLTSESGTGTTIRIDWKVKRPDKYGVYFNCQTNLIKRFRTRYPSIFEFEGNRAILLDVNKPLPLQQLSKCLAEALVYHRDKRSADSL